MGRLPTLGIRMADYVLEGPKWGGSGLGTAGGVVTWEIDPTISLNMLALIVTAFADWASWANIQFQQVAASVDADIAFTVGAIDGLDNVLGTTQYWYSGSSFVSADIEFDSGEGWYNSGSSVVSSDGLDFFMVALHEIGHAIGMDHYNTTPAVMNAFLNTSIHDLQASDIHGIQAIYGTPVTYAAGASGDFSGEGAYDVLWQNYVTNDVGFWTLADNTPRWTDIGIASSTVNMVGTGDVNGDGTSDILWQNPTNGYARCVDDVQWRGDLAGDRARLADHEGRRASAISTATERPTSSGRIRPTTSSANGRCITASRPGVRSIRDRRP